MLPVNRWLLNLAVIISGFLIAASGFNFDAGYPLIGVGEGGSYFGYSVAVHENNPTKWLIVGAPKGKYSSSGLSGVLYQCLRSGLNLNCNPVNSGFPLDMRGRDQWLGATVVSRNGTAMVCAPRNGEQITGECYYSRGSLSSFTRYTPVTTPFSEIGFSATLSSDGNRFYTGGPSQTNNNGTVVASTGPNQNKVDKFVNDTSFLGYALAQGKVYNQKESLVVSVGFHHSSNYSGKVIILDSGNQLNAVGSLVGHQAGEHFGASLAVSDVNKDGRDDIIVGAPHYCDYTNPEILFDIGAVYIYYQKSDGTFTNQLLKGRSAGGEFGFAVAGLGDSDRDGFNDLAVGAPYENDGSGTVYIYQGSSNGLRDRPSQIIEGNYFYPPIRTLGFSFNSAASDFDNNGYHDLIVGAYQSDNVVLLPARPVVRITSTIQFTPPSIVFNNKKCNVTLSNGNLVDVACTSMKYCLIYDGFGLPNSLMVNILIVLDAKLSKGQRLLFLDSNQYKLTQKQTLEFKKQFCQDKVVYIKPDYRVQISPMEVTLNTSLVVESPGPLSPVLDIYNGNGFVSNSISVYRNCGPDNVCTPDLQLTATMSSDTYVQGTNQLLTIDVTIFNAGEETNGVRFFLNFPSVLKYNNMDAEYTDSSVSCSPPSIENNNYLICDVGTLLQANMAARLRIIAKPSPKNDRIVTLVAETNSSDPENFDTLADNSKSLTLTFLAETSLALNGWSRPEALIVSTGSVETYKQYYEVRNVGPSDVLSAILRITFPIKTIEGYVINELIGQPYVNEGPAVCKTTEGESTIDIECSITRMIPKERTVVYLEAQLSSEALTKQISQEFIISSLMRATITGLPFDQDVSAIPSSNATVTLKVTKTTQDSEVLQAVPVWIPIVSAIGGIIIVSGLAYLLDRYGFFKRRGLKELTAELNAHQENEPLQDLDSHQTST